MNTSPKVKAGAGCHLDLMCHSPSFTQLVCSAERKQRCALSFLTATSLLTRPIPSSVNQSTFVSLTSWFHCSFSLVKPKHLKTSRNCTGPWLSMTQACAVQSWAPSTGPLSPSLLLREGLKVLFSQNTTQTQHPHAPRCASSLKYGHSPCSLHTPLTEQWALTPAMPSTLGWVLHFTAS